MNFSETRVASPALALVIGLFGILGVMAAVAPGAALVDPPLGIGQIKQLFIDDFVIGSLKDLQRKVHEPRRYEQNPILTGTESWEKWLIGVNGRPVLYDQETREFKMWYGTYLSDKAAPSGLRYRVCYATSKDGIHWVRPDLGEVEWEGSRKNNLIKWGVQWMRRPNVIKDLHDPDSSRRYKMTYVDVFDGKTAITKAFSADGIRWQLNADGKPWFRMNHGANLLGWDPRVERYVIFTKMPGSQDSMGRATSTDFLNWSDPQTVLAPGATERNASFPGLTAFFYGDIYLGFLYNFERQPDGFLVSQAELAMSRDGVKWQRVAPGESCFRLGSSGSWESHGVFPVAPVIQKDRIMVFYNAWNVPYGSADQKRLEAGWVENGVRKQYAIGLATLRLDGFVSLEAGSRPGSLTTRTVEVAGGSLEVNANVRGDLRVELLDEAEWPLEGYGAADCEPVQSDSLRHVIRWRGKSSLDALRGRPARLRFLIRDGGIYAFQFVREKS